MATIAFFHAHPDDEAIATGGTMAMLKEQGHRVVAITATRGEEGEVADGFLADGELLADRRTQEMQEACRILGVDFGHFLGYRDSGMQGEPTNDHPDCFWQADVEEAARRLADVLTEQGVDVLTVYDDHGNYGHPDHVQVHRVGVRAADLAGITRVYEATIDRDTVRSLSQELSGAVSDDEAAKLGMPSEQITTRVDVQGQMATKRKAMLAHASQITPESWFLQISEDVFERLFSTESYIRRGAAPGLRETSIVDGLD